MPDQTDLTFDVTSPKISALLCGIFYKFDLLRIACHLKFFQTCLESLDPKRSAGDDVERAQKTMRNGQMIGEMFDGVGKQIKPFS